MNLIAMKEIIANSIYHDPRPETLKRQSPRKSIESGKKQTLFDEERINLNENAIKSLFVSFF